MTANMKSLKIIPFHRIVDAVHRASTTEQELDSIHWAIKHFLVRSDHRPLAYLFSLACDWTWKNMKVLWNTSREGIIILLTLYHA